MQKKEEKIIYKAYKQFYNKEPNFSKENLENITIEIQFMIYILNEYGVSLGANRFCYEYTDLSMPMAMYTQDIIVGKLIDKNDDLNDEALVFSKSAQEIINIIGNIIRNIITDKKNQVEQLKQISNILYVKKYVFPLATDEEIKKKTNCTEEDICNAYQLIKLIDKERSKDNFDKKNIANITKMIDSSDKATHYGMFVDESASGKLPEITEGSRKKLAKSLIK